MAEELKILVVENNYAHQKLIKQALLNSNPGYKIDTLKFGRECAKKLKKSKYQLLILDYSLDDIDGLNVMDDLKMKKINLPVIMVTGKGDEDIAVEAMKKGAYDYIRKSGSYQELLVLRAGNAIEQFNLKKDKEKLNYQLKKEKDMALREARAHKNKAKELNEVNLKLNAANEKIKRNQKELKKRLAELERTRQQLIQSEKMSQVGRLAGGVAHEINNPMGSILASAQLMMEEMGEKGPCREELRIIENSVLKCRNIVRRLLEFSRKSEKKKEKVNLNKALDNVISLINRQVEFKNIKIKKSIENKLPPVYAGSQGIEQVFLNLLVNSRDAMPGGGEILIKTKKVFKKDKSFVFVSLKDSGT
ncbi:MAG: response regulator, partial [Elusimicrobiota bacterium]